MKSKTLKTGVCLLLAVTSVLLSVEKAHAQEPPQEPPTPCKPDDPSATEGSNSCGTDKVLFPVGPETRTTMCLDLEGDCTVEEYEGINQQFEYRREGDVNSLRCAVYRVERTEDMCEARQPGYGWQPEPPPPPAEPEPPGPPGPPAFPGLA